MMLPQTKQSILTSLDTGYSGQTSSQSISLEGL